MRIITAFILILSLCSCSVPSFSPANKPVFYVLQSPSPMRTGKSLLQLSILPPILPSYLDRTQIVSRNPSRSEIIVHEYDLWGEDLSQGIARVLCSALAGYGIETMPLTAGIQADKRLVIEIRRFDGAVNDVVQMDAVWTIRQDGNEPISRQFHSTEPSGKDMNSMVQAMSLLTEKLARDIATHK